MQTGLSAVVERRMGVALNMPPHHPRTITVMTGGPGLCDGAPGGDDHHARERHEPASRDHADGARGGADRRHLAAVLALLLAFMVVEVVVAVLAHSLALLADAGHMVIDAGAVGGSLWAMHLAARPSSPVWSFGLKRAEILAAAANGVTLLVVGVLVGVEAVGRLVHPHHVHGVPVLAVALTGVAVNIAATAVLARADRGSLNIQGAFQHILTDLYGFIGTGAAAIVIIATGWARADAIASIAVVVLVLRAAWRLLRASGHILLEGTPDTVDLEEVRRHLAELSEVIAVHDLHAWTLTSALPALTAHVVVTDACLANGSAGIVLDHLQRCLADHFDVEHSTFQLEAPSHAAHEPGTHD
jgi:cobalt-zinc-cadmium efflux system protein